MQKRLLFLTLIFTIITSALHAQNIQIDLDNPIIIEPEDIGNVCTLDPTEINAHYFIKSDAIREKVPSLQASSTFEISYQSSCGGDTWPQEAQDALEFAAEIWSNHLSSPIPIRIDANWVNQNDNVLGSAGPTTFFRVTGDDIPDAVYSIAQASALVEEDLATNENIGFDIVVNINCNFSDWYFGTDANTPTGLIDFVTVALHEIGHGIGFLGTVGANNTSRTATHGFTSGDDFLPYIYETFAVDGFFNNMDDKDVFPNDTQEMYDIVTGRNNGLFFDGRESELANDAENSVELFAPAEFRPGSSFSHLDQQIFSNTENALMRPSVDRAFAIHNPGPVMCGMLDDMMWPLGDACLAQLADPDLLRKPILAAPFNNDSDQIQTPEFFWEPVNNANNYQIQVSEDFEFTDFITDQTIAGTTFTLNQELETTSTYFWRVRGINNQEQGPWSNTWSFSTVDEVPDAISLNSPDDGEENLRPGFQLNWDQAERANQYNIQISEDSEFSDLFVDRRISGTTFSATQDFPFLTTFFWRVRGVNDGGEGEWSEVRSFTTIIERPAAVALGSPGDNENQVSTSPQFTWDESARASDYILQVSLEDNFSDNIIETTVSDPSFSVQMSLESATIYFWRVRATNIGGESDWSNTFTFTTEVLETLVDNNYPNPFNTETTIRYQLSRQTDVLLDVYDIVGRRVATLVNEEQSAGVYFVPMDATGMSSGTYLVRFVAGDVNDVQKMTLVK